MNKSAQLLAGVLVIPLIFLHIACSRNNEAENIIPPDAVKDSDGNSYDVITIGAQKWLKQNLRTTHYRNGQPIPQVTDPAVWDTLNTGAWCWYNNDSATYAATYGKLYNWYAVSDPRGIAPDSFHIPDDVEWTILSSSLGGNTVSGGAMKEAGISHWLSPNTSATNSSKFTGLPSGFRNSNGIFNGITYSALYWSTTVYDAGNSYCRELFYLHENLMRNNNLNKNGFAVRCIHN